MTTPITRRTFLKTAAATGFLAAGPWDESGLRDINENSADRVVAQYLDRDDVVTSVMTTFAGLTVHCARCPRRPVSPLGSVRCRLSRRRSCPPNHLQSATLREHFRLHPLRAPRPGDGLLTHSEHR